MKRLARRRLWIGVGLGALGLIAALGWFTVRRLQGRATLFGGGAPGIAAEPLAEAQIPAPADAFDFPLDPERFGVYNPGESGRLPVDTHFGVQNPGLGNAGKCFVNRDGKKVAFGQLYHAGEDWFALDERGRVVWGETAGEPVRAVANGVVDSVTLMGYDGYVIIVAHQTAEGNLWSVYWHVADVQVAQGQAVTLGQTLAYVHDRGLNSHLHWEIRTFGDGSALFPEDSAGGRGTCNGYITGVGYTWDDDAERSSPEFWGYREPGRFVRERGEF